MSKVIEAIDAQLDYADDTLNCVEAEFVNAYDNRNDIDFATAKITAAISGGILGAMITWLKIEKVKAQATEDKFDEFWQGVEKFFKALADELTEVEKPDPKSVAEEIMDKILESRDTKFRG